MVVNVFLAFSLMWSLKEGGLALANTLSSTMNACALLVALRVRIGSLGGREMLASALRTILATTVMAVACVIVWHALICPIKTEPPRAAAAWVLLPTALGLAVFTFSALLLRAPELDQVLASLRRRRQPAGAGGKKT
jgi:peptidoglycan biosynthesis protein MviN/MurJ (putative lipid II flippase)